MLVSLNRKWARPSIAEVITLQSAKYPLLKACDFPLGRPGELKAWKQGARCRRGGSLDADGLKRSSLKDNVEGQLVGAMLEAGVVAEIGRRYIVINITEVSVVGQIKGADRPAHRVVANPGKKREAEILGDLQIE